MRRVLERIARPGNIKHFWNLEARVLEKHFLTSSRKNPGIGSGAREFWRAFGVPRRAYKEVSWVMKSSLVKLGILVSALAVPGIAMAAPFRAADSAEKKETKKKDDKKKKDVKPKEDK
jgi:hypothetical protein